MNPEYFLNADITLFKAYDHAAVKKAFDYIVMILLLNSAIRREDASKGRM